MAYMGQEIGVDSQNLTSTIHTLLWQTLMCAHRHTSVPSSSETAVTHLSSSITIYAQHPSALKEKKIVNAFS